MVNDTIAPAAVASPIPTITAAPPARSEWVGTAAMCANGVMLTSHFGAPSSAPISCHRNVIGASPCAMPAAARGATA